jgi:hypothetical protein
MRTSKKSPPMAGPPRKRKAKRSGPPRKAKRPYKGSKKQADNRRKIATSSGSTAKSLLPVKPKRGTSNAAKSRRPS